MKKLLSLILILLLVTLCGCSTNNENEPVLLAPNGDYKFELFDNCVIMGGSINDDSLSYNNQIICKGSFFKYSAFDNRYVAIHNMDLIEAPYDNADAIKFSMDTVNINKSIFILFDAENQSLTEFENIEAFNNECHKKSLNFDNWYYRGTESEKIIITDNCYIENAGNYRGQFLYYNNVPILEGIISSYEFDNDCLTFEFKLVDSDYGPEFPEMTNQNLNLKEYQVSKKYHVEGLLFFNVTYEAYIAFDTKTGNYKEYKNDKEYKSEKDYPPLEINASESSITENEAIDIALSELEAFSSEKYPNYDRIKAVYMSDKCWHILLGFNPDEYGNAIDIIVDDNTKHIIDVIPQE